MKIKHHTLGILLSGLLCALPCTGAAASYPDRPIRLIAPIAVGGLTDTLARLVAAGLSEELKQPVVVENKPGAGGIIGMEAAAKSAPDGYTIILVYQGVAAVNTSLHKDLPYNTQRDFTPISSLGSFPLVLVTNGATGIQSVSGFIERAKSKPNSLSYASAGNATTSHLTMELFKDQTGIKIVHVPYKGESPANTDVAGGQVDVAFSSLASVAPMIEAGRLKALGIATAEPSPLLKGVPTITSSGVPGFEASGWYGLLAPAGTPPAIIETLSTAVGKALNQSSIRQKLEALGVASKASSPDEFGRQIESETEKWRNVIRKSGITLG